MTDAYVLGGVRTPVGRYGGALSHIRTDDLLGRTMVAACERVGVPLERVEDIVAGGVSDALVVLEGPRGPLRGAGIGPRARDSHRSRSTSGRSTRPTPRSPSRSCASRPTSSAASRSPTSA